MHDNQFAVIDWGGRKTLWVDSDKIDECITYYRNNRLDGLGINPMHGYRLHEVNFLQDNPDVTGLVIVPSTVEIDISAITSLKQLRYLSISDNRQPLDLDEFPHLEEYRGDWHKELHFSSACSTLRSLHLWKYKPKTKDLMELPEFPSLTELGLTQASIVSLTGLLRWSTIRRLELSYIRNLISLAPAQELSALKVLHCERCPKLRDYEILSAAGALSDLRLNNCGSIATLDFLRRMPELKEFRFVNTNVEDGDLTPLLQLERVGFTNKRHFSHKSEEIEVELKRRNKGNPKSIPSSESPESPTQGNLE